MPSHRVVGAPNEGTASEKARPASCAERGHPAWDPSSWDPVILSEAKNLPLAPANEILRFAQQ